MNMSKVGCDSGDRDGGDSDGVDRDGGDRDGCDCDDYGIFNFVNGFVGGNF